MKDKVVFSVSKDYFRIDINDKPHFCYRIDLIVGFQSWINEKITTTYCIEYYTAERSILTEYVDRELWQEILGHLKTKLLLVSKR